MFKPYERITEINGVKTYVYSSMAQMIWHTVLCVYTLLGLLVGSLLVLAGAWFADRTVFWQLVQMYADLFEMMRRILPRYD